MSIIKSKHPNFLFHAVKIKEEINKSLMETSTIGQNTSGLAFFKNIFALVKILLNINTD